MKPDGILLALDREDAKRFFGEKDESRRLELVNELKDSLPDSRRMVCGPWWQQLHRGLTDGRLRPDAGSMPLNHAFLGGQRMYSGPECYVKLVRPDLVPHVATALAEIERNWFRERCAEFEVLEPTPAANEQFDQLWNALHQVQQFYERAARQSCAVVFTAPKQEVKPE